MIDEEQGSQDEFNREVIGLLRELVKSVDILNDRVGNLETRMGGVEEGVENLKTQLSGMSR